MPGLLRQTETALLRYRYSENLVYDLEVVPKTIYMDTNQDKWVMRAYDVNAREDVFLLMSEIISFADKF